MSYKKLIELNCLKSQTIEGDSPVSEEIFLMKGHQVPQDTCNLVGIWEDHLPRLNTTQ